MLQVNTYDLVRCLAHCHIGDAAEFDFRIELRIVRPCNLKCKRKLSPNCGLENPTSRDCVSVVTLDPLPFGRRRFPYLPLDQSLCSTAPDIVGRVAAEVDKILDYLIYWL